MESLLSHPSSEEYKACFQHGYPLDGLLLSKGKFSRTFNATLTPEKLKENLRLQKSFGLEESTQVAVKIIFADLGHNELATLAHALPQEIAASYQLLGVPNTVNIFDVFVKSKRIFIVMEPCVQDTLYQEISQFPDGVMDEPVARHFFREIVKSVQTLHDRGVAHCNMTPANISITDGSLVKLHEFGASVISSRRSTKATKTESGCSSNSSSFISHPGYAAPEVLNQANLAKNPRAAKAADLWSLGVLLFRLVNGKAPFRGKTVEKVSTFHRQFFLGKFLLPFNNKLSHDCKNLIFALLEQDPKARLEADVVLHHTWMQKEAKRPSNFKKKRAKPATYAKASGKHLEHEKDVRSYLDGRAKLLAEVFDVARKQGKTVSRIAAIRVCIPSEVSSVVSTAHKKDLWRTGHDITLQASDFTRDYSSGKAKIKEIISDLSPYKARIKPIPEGSLTAMRKSATSSVERGASGDKKHLFNKESMAKVDTKKQRSDENSGTPKKGLSKKEVGKTNRWAKNSIAAKIKASPKKLSKLLLASIKGNKKEDSVQLKAAATRKGAKERIKDLSANTDSEIESLPDDSSSYQTEIPLSSKHPSIPKSQSFRYEKSPDESGCSSKEGSSKVPTSNSEAMFNVITKKVSKKTPLFGNVKFDLPSAREPCSTGSCSPEESISSNTPTTNSEAMFNVVAKKVTKKTPIVENVMFDLPSACEPSSTGLCSTKGSSSSNTPTMNSEAMFNVVTKKMTKKTPFLENVMFDLPSACEPSSTGSCSTNDSISSNTPTMNSEAMFNVVAKKVTKKTPFLGNVMFDLPSGCETSSTDEPKLLSTSTKLLKTNQQHAEDVSQAKSSKSSISESFGELLSLNQLTQKNEVAVDKNVVNKKTQNCEEQRFHKEKKEKISTISCDSSISEDFGKLFSLSQLTKKNEVAVDKSVEMERKQNSQKQKFQKVKKEEISTTACDSSISECFGELLSLSQLTKKNQVAVDKNASKKMQSSDKQKFPVEKKETMTASYDTSISEELEFCTEATGDSLSIQSTIENIKKPKIQGNHGKGGKKQTEPYQYNLTDTSISTDESVSEELEFVSETCNDVSSASPNPGFKKPEKQIELTKSRRFGFDFNQTEHQKSAFKLTSDSSTVSDGGSISEEIDFRTESENESCCESYEDSKKQDKSISEEMDYFSDTCTSTVPKPNILKTEKRAGLKKSPSFGLYVNQKDQIMTHKPALKLTCDSSVASGDGSISEEIDFRTESENESTSVSYGQDDSDKRGKSDHGKLPHRKVEDYQQDFTNASVSTENSVTEEIDFRTESEDGSDCLSSGKEDSEKQILTKKEGKRSGTSREKTNDYSSDFTTENIFADASKVELCSNSSRDDVPPKSSKLSQSEVSMSEECLCDVSFATETSTSSSLQRKIDSYKLKQFIEVDKNKRCDQKDSAPTLTQERDKHFYSSDYESEVSLKGGPSTEEIKSCSGPIKITSKSFNQSESEFSVSEYLSDISLGSDTSTSSSLQRKIDSYKLKEFIERDENKRNKSKEAATKPIQDNVSYSLSYDSINSSDYASKYLPDDSRTDNSLSKQERTHKVSSKNRDDQSDNILLEESKTETKAISETIATNSAFKLDKDDYKSDFTVDCSSNGTALESNLDKDCYDSDFIGTYSIDDDSISEVIEDVYEDHSGASTIQNSLSDSRYNVDMKVVDDPKFKATENEHESLSSVCALDVKSDKGVETLSYKIVKGLDPSSMGLSDHGDRKSPTDETAVIKKDKNTLKIERQELLPEAHCVKHDSAKQSESDLREVAPPSHDNHCNVEPQDDNVMQNAEYELSAYDDMCSITESICLGSETMSSQSNNCSDPDSDIFKLDTSKAKSKSLRSEMPYELTDSASVCSNKRGDKSFCENSVPISNPTTNDVLHCLVAKNSETVSTTDHKTTKKDFEVDEAGVPSLSNAKASEKIMSASFNNENQKCRCGLETSQLPLKDVLLNKENLSTFPDNATSSSTDDEVLDFSFNDFETLMGEVSSKDLDNWSVSNSARGKNANLAPCDNRIYSEQTKLQVCSTSKEAIPIHSLDYSKTSQFPLKKVSLNHNNASNYDIDVSASTDDDEVLNFSFNDFETLIGEANSPSLVDDACGDSPKGQIIDLTTCGYPIDGEQSKLQVDVTPTEAIPTNCIICPDTSQFPLKDVSLKNDNVCNYTDDDISVSTNEESFEFSLDDFEALISEARSKDLDKGKLNHSHENEDVKSIICETTINSDRAKLSVDFISEKAFETPSLDYHQTTKLFSKTVPTNNDKPSNSTDNDLSDSTDNEVVDFSFNDFETLMDGVHSKNSNKGSLSNFPEGKNVNVTACEIQSANKPSKIQLDATSKKGFPLHSMEHSERSQLPQNISYKSSATVVQRVNAIADQCINVLLDDIIKCSASVTSLMKLHKIEGVKDSQCKIEGTCCKKVTAASIPNFKEECLRAVQAPITELSDTRANVEIRVAEDYTHDDIGNTNIGTANETSLETELKSQSDSIHSRNEVQLKLPNEDFLCNSSSKSRSILSNDESDSLESSHEDSQTSDCRSSTEGSDLDDDPKDSEDGYESDFDFGSATSIEGSDLDDDPKDSEDGYESDFDFGSATSIEENTLSECIESDIEAKSGPNKQFLTMDEDANKVEKLNNEVCFETNSFHIEDKLVDFGKKRCTGHADGLIDAILNETSISECASETDDAAENIESSTESTEVSQANNKMEYPQTEEKYDIRSEGIASESEEKTLSCKIPKSPVSLKLRPIADVDDNVASTEKATFKDIEVFGRNSSSQISTETEPLSNKDTLCFTTDSDFLNVEIFKPQRTISASLTPTKVRKHDVIDKESLDTSKYSRFTDSGAVTVKTNTVKKKDTDPVLDSLPNEVDSSDSSGTNQEQVAPVVTTFKRGYGADELWPDFSESDADSLVFMKTSPNQYKIPHVHDQMLSSSAEDAESSASFLNSQQDEESQLLNNHKGLANLSEDRKLAKGQKWSKGFDDHSSFNKLDQLVTLTEEQGSQMLDDRFALLGDQDSTYVSSDWTYDSLATIIKPVEEGRFCETANAEHGHLGGEGSDDGHMESAKKSSTKTSIDKYMIVLDNSSSSHFCKLDKKDSDPTKHAMSLFGRKTSKHTQGKIRTPFNESAVELPESWKSNFNENCVEFEFIAVPEQAGRNTTSATPEMMPSTKTYYEEDSAGNGFTALSKARASSFNKYYTPAFKSSKQWFSKHPLELIPEENIVIHQRYTSPELDKCNALADITDRHSLRKSRLYVKDECIQTSVEAMRETISEEGAHKTCNGCTQTTQDSYTQTPNDVSTQTTLENGTQTRIDEDIQGTGDEVTAVKKDNVYVSSKTDDFPKKEQPLTVDISIENAPAYCDDLGNLKIQIRIGDASPAPFAQVNNSTEEHDIQLEACTNDSHESHSSYEISHCPLGLVTNAFLEDVVELISSSNSTDDGYLPCTPDSILEGTSDTCSSSDMDVRDAFTAMSRDRALVGTEVEIDDESADSEGDEQSVSDVHVAHDEELVESEKNSTIVSMEEIVNVEAYETDVVKEFNRNSSVNKTTDLKDKPEVDGHPELRYSEKEDVITIVSDDKKVHCDAKTAFAECLAASCFDVESVDDIKDISEMSGTIVEEKIEQSFQTPRFLCRQNPEYYENKASDITEGKVKETPKEENVFFQPLESVVKKNKIPRKRRLKRYSRTTSNVGRRDFLDDEPSSDDYSNSTLSLNVKNGRELQKLSILSNDYDDSNDLRHSNIYTRSPRTKENSDAPVTEDETVHQSMESKEGENEKLLGMLRKEPTNVSQSDSNFTSDESFENECASLSRKNAAEDCKFLPLESVSACKSLDKTGGSKTNEKSLTDEFQGQVSAGEVEECIVAERSIKYQKNDKGNSLTSSDDLREFSIANKSSLQTFRLTTNVVLSLENEESIHVGIFSAEEKAIHSHNLTMERSAMPDVNSQTHVEKLGRPVDVEISDESINGKIHLENKGEASRIKPVDAEGNSRSGEFYNADVTEMLNLDAQNLEAAKLANVLNDSHTGEAGDILQDIFKNNQPVTTSLRLISLYPTLDEPEDICNTNEVPSKTKNDAEAKPGMGSAMSSICIEDCKSSFPHSNNASKKIYNYKKIENSTQTFQTTQKNCETQTLSISQWKTSGVFESDEEVQTVSIKKHEKIVQTDQVLKNEISTQTDEKSKREIAVQMLKEEQENELLQTEKPKVKEVAVQVEGIIVNYELVQTEHNWMDGQTQEVSLTTCEEEKQKMTNRHQENKEDSFQECCKENGFNKISKDEICDYSPRREDTVMLLKDESQTETSQKQSAPCDDNFNSCFHTESKNIIVIDSKGKRKTSKQKNDEYEDDFDSCSDSELRESTLLSFNVDFKRETCEAHINDYEDDFDPSSDSEEQAIESDEESLEAADTISENDERLEDKNEMFEDDIEQLSVKKGLISWVKVYQERIAMGYNCLLSYVNSIHGLRSILKRSKSETQCKEPKYLPSQELNAQDKLNPQRSSSSDSLGEQASSASASHGDDNHPQHSDNFDSSIADPDIERKNLRKQTKTELTEDEFDDLLENEFASLCKGEESSNHSVPSNKPQEGKTKQSEKSSSPISLEFDDRRSDVTAFESSADGSKQGNLSDELGAFPQTSSLTTTRMAWPDDVNYEDEVHKATESELPENYETLECDQTKATSDKDFQSGSNKSVHFSNTIAECKIISPRNEFAWFHNPYGLQDSGTKSSLKPTLGEEYAEAYKNDVVGEYDDCDELDDFLEMGYACMLEDNDQTTKPIPIHGIQLHRNVESFVPSKSNTSCKDELDEFLELEYACMLSEEKPDDQTKQCYHDENDIHSMSGTKYMDETDLLCAVTHREKCKSTAKEDTPQIEGQMTTSEMLPNKNLSCQLLHQCDEKLQNNDVPSCSNASDRRLVSPASSAVGHPDVKFSSFHSDSSKTKLLGDEMTEKSQITFQQSSSDDELDEFLRLEYACMVEESTQQVKQNLINQAEESSKQETITKPRDKREKSQKGMPFSPGKLLTNKTTYQPTDQQTMMIEQSALNESQGNNTFLPDLANVLVRGGNFPFPSTGCLTKVKQERPHDRLYASGELSENSLMDNSPTRSQTLSSSEGLISDTPRDSGRDMQLMKKEPLPCRSRSTRPLITLKHKIRRNINVFAKFVEEKLFPPAVWKEMEERIS